MGVTALAVLLFSGVSATCETLVSAVFSDDVDIVEEDSSVLLLPRGVDGRSAVVARFG